MEHLTVLKSHTFFLSHVCWMWMKRLILKQRSGGEWEHITLGFPILRNGFYRFSILNHDDQIFQKSTVDLGSGLYLVSWIWNNFSWYHILEKNAKWSHLPKVTNISQQHTTTSETDLAPWCYEWTDGIWMDGMVNRAGVSKEHLAVPIIIFMTIWFCDLRMWQ